MQSPVSPSIPAYFYFINQACKALPDVHPGHFFRVVCAASHLDRSIKDFGQRASLLAIYYKNSRFHRFSIPNLDTNLL